MVGAKTVVASVALLSVLTGCGVHWTLGASTARVHRVAEGGGAVYSIVRAFERRDGAGVFSAVRLPSGDWIASVVLDGDHVVRLAQDGSLRWRRAGRLVLSRGPAGEIFGIGHLDAEERIEVVRLDPSGEVAWRFETEQRGAAEASLVVIEAQLIVSTGSLVQAFDSDGHPRWTHHPPEAVRLRELRRSGDQVLALGAVEGSSEADGPPLDCVVQRLDPHTGTLEGEARISPLGTSCQMHQSSVHRGHLVLWLFDRRVQRVGPQSTESSSRARVVVLDEHLSLTHELEVPTGQASGDESLRTGEAPRLRAGEAALIDVYPREGRLRVLAVHVERGAIRVETALQIEPMSGRGANPLEGYAQLSSVRVEPGAITFAGHFVGRARAPGGALESGARVLDGCAAQGGIECFGNLPPVWVTPGAGLFGLIVPTVDHAPN